MRPRSLRALAGAAAVVAMVPGAAPRGAVPRETARRPSKVVRHVAPGVTYVRIVRRHPPNRINVLRVAVRKRPSIDVALPLRKTYGFARTSRMAARYGAIAAVNGTYTLPTGRPYSVFARNGELKASPLLWSRAFSLSADERLFYAGHPKLSLRVQVPTERDDWQLTAFNRLPDEPEMSAYSPIGGRFYAPPLDACSARLRRSSTLSWDPENAGVKRWYTVQAVRCAEDRMLRRDKLVLAARRHSAPGRDVDSLDVGERVEMGWAVGWPGAVDVMGGNPLLVSKGRVVAPAYCPAAFCARHPRTGVGITRGGVVLLVTVDGRQRRSIGMTLAGFGHVLQDLGAVTAINIDGGGSTTMVVNGRVVNHPSDGRERRVGSSVLVYRTDRPTFAPPPNASSQAHLAAARAAQVDPASTGGMLRAVAGGDLGRARKVPRALLVPAPSQLKEAPRG